MNINYEYYKIFYYVAKNKNVTKAANELNISQPAISRVIKSLEEQLNIKLFIRDRKGVILTQEGNELYKLISSEISNIIKAENTFSKIINNNTIKIATNKTYLNYLINNHKIDKIIESNSDIGFIEPNDFDLLNHQLSNNLIDFAFISEPTNYTFDKNIKFKELYNFNLILVSNSKNDKITDKPFALLNDNKFSKLYDFYIKSTNISPKGIIRVDDYDNLYSLIINGYANGFIIKELVVNELNKNLIYELSSNINVTLKMGILYNINNELKIKKYFGK